VPDFGFYPAGFVIDRSDVVSAGRKHDKRVVKRLGRQRSGWFEFGLLRWRRGLVRCGRFRGFVRFRLLRLGRFRWLRRRLRLRLRRPTVAASRAASR
jgi:hypothetical protein